MEDQITLQANENNNDKDNPWYCSCYSDKLDLNTIQQKEDLPAGTGLEAEPTIVPDTFSQPPKKLMDKINNNLQPNRVLIVAAANYGMRNHAYNWIESLKKTGEDKFLILCLDERLYQHLILSGYEQHAATIPDTWIHQPIEAGFEEYYSQKYRIITHAKTLVVQQLLYLDINVIFSDVDVVWLKPRIREYLYTFLEIRETTDVVFQQEGSEQKEVNTGFYIMRPTDNMKRLLAATIYLGDQDKGLTQQGALNKALDYMNLQFKVSPVVLLDVLHWPNGWIYFSNNWNNIHGIDPYIIHANYLVGEDKKNKLRENNFWYVDDDWLENMDKRLDNSTKIQKEKSN
ncbi:nucleotide-diphospho-sugar transferase-domain-containing protein [Cunninghamella echinulata]|nr:nucleotide-diphospho-sugar transferase-domain-containing protein [Cunninghamella echinulata]